jgi:hypothetical protein
MDAVAEELGEPGGGLVEDGVGNHLKLRNGECGLRNERGSECAWVAFLKIGGFVVAANALVGGDDAPG